MSEIYWLTRLVILGKVCLIFSFIFFIIWLIFIAGYLEMKDSSDDDEFIISRKSIKRGFKLSPILFFICFLGAWLIPSKKDMLLIYGVGPIYDYVQDNDKVKQLPDKCIEYLDALLEQEKEDSKK